MKRVKLTFWIIGFGCGMVVAGMIGALLTLNIQKVEEEQKYITSTQQDESLTENKKIEEIAVPSTELAQVNDVEKNINSIENNLKEQGIEEQVGKKQEEEETVRVVTIPAKLSASEICKILEESGIVKNGNEFLDYVKAQKKQTYLKSGQYTLPVEASYDIILNELIS